MHGTKEKITKTKPQNHQKPNKSYKERIKQNYQKTEPPLGDSAEHINLNPNPTKKLVLIIPLLKYPGNRKNMTFSKLKTQ